MTSLHARIAKLEKSLHQPQRDTAAHLEAQFRYDFALRTPVETRGEEEWRLIEAGAPERGAGPSPTADDLIRAMLRVRNEFHQRNGYEAGRPHRT